MKKRIDSPHAPAATAHFSQAIQAGNLIFTAGQIHLNASGELLTGTIEEETHQVMKNLKAVLEAAGASFKDVVKASVYLTDLSVYPKVKEVYASYMSEPYPARETIGANELPLGARVEISMIAVKA
jgi:2-iminobutanoate/2-iminopropanoate deaminase